MFYEMYLAQWHQEALIMVFEMYNSHNSTCTWNVWDCHSEVLISALLEALLREQAQRTTTD